MSNSWRSLLFETCELGVSSAVVPELLPNNQVAWGMNIDVRGGKPATRPNIAARLVLPPGLIQGCEYFGVQGGMLVASIAGRMWRIRINGRSFSYEEIPLDFQNSATVKQVWMTQTIETLVIQDGQSDPILYNGSTAPRAGPTQVPRGRQMGYGNGRLWVAVDANNVLAGDIRTGAAGSELYFTEATYLQGGGKLFFGSAITGMAFIPVTGQSDYGALLVYGARETNAIRADITSRDDWGKIPGFVTAILRSVGAASQWSVFAVNQDLYWRDSNGGIRSIRNALADEAGPGSAPISREVSRLTDYDSQQLLPFCSGVYFDNRMLMTSSPFLMPNGGIGWKNIIPLDFAPLSTMGGKTQPAYDGKWNGINFVKLVSGQFRGKHRAFALSTDDNGINELWEFGTGSRADGIIDCTDGTGEIVLMENPITCLIEYPRRNFGESKRRKRLDRCDVWLSDVSGELDLTVYWRSDNSQKWIQWDQAPSTCAQTTDPATESPHVWKNLQPQERPQFKTFTIPDGIDEVIKYSAHVGFEFQIRLVWTGRCRIHRMMLHAELLADPDYADRTGYEVSCVENDVSGNNVEYTLRTNCDDCVVTFEAQPQTVITFGDTATYSVAATSPTPGIIYQWQVSSDSGVTWSNLEDDEIVSGSDTDTLNLQDIPTDWNTYLFRCNVILPGCGTGGGGGGRGQVIHSDSAAYYIPFSVGCETLEGRTRGGTYHLVGVPEFVSPSVPPKIFRKNTVIGSLTSYSGPGCSSLFITQSWSGLLSYNAITGVPTDSRCYSEGGGCNPFGSPLPSQVPGTSGWTNAFIGEAGCGSPSKNCLQGAGPQLSSCSGVGVCVDCGSGFHIQTDGLVTAMLSDEDTNSDAIIRLLNSAPWSAYSACGDNSCLTSLYQLRGAGQTSGAYQEAQFRVTAAIPMGHAGFVRVGVYRRLYGSSDPYVIVATLQVVMIGDSMGVGTSSDQGVDNAAGYETYVACLPPD
jgi:hypothetical protein